MAYSGFLIKAGNYAIPIKFIQLKSYSVTRNVMDLDSYRDANGVLHRTALEHVPIKIEFNTPYLTSEQMQELLKKIADNYISSEERKVMISAYVPELDSYITQDMYMPDLEFTIYNIKGGTIIYEPLRIAFIGY